MRLNPSCLPPEPSAPAKTAAAIALCAVAATLILGSGARAAAPAPSSPPSPQPRQDAQNRYEPRSLPGAGQARRSITRTRLEEEGRVLVHRHYLVQDDGKERLMMELRLTRRASKPAAALGG